MRDAAPAAAPPPPTSTVMEYKFTLTPGKVVTLTFSGEQPDLVDVELLEAYMRVIRQGVERAKAKPDPAVPPFQRAGLDSVEPREAESA